MDLKFILNNKHICPSTPESDGKKRFTKIAKYNHASASVFPPKPIEWSRKNAYNSPDINTEYQCQSGAQDILPISPDSFWQSVNFRIKKKHSVPFGFSRSTWFTDTESTPCSDHVNKCALAFIINDYAEYKSTCDKSTVATESKQQSVDKSDLVKCEKQGTFSIAENAAKSQPSGNNVEYSASDTTVYPAALQKNIHNEIDNSLCEQKLWLPDRNQSTLGSKSRPTRRLLYDTYTVIMLSDGVNGNASSYAFRRSERSATCKGENTRAEELQNARTLVEYSPGYRRGEKVIISSDNESKYTNLRAEKRKVRQAKSSGVCTLRRSARIAKLNGTCVHVSPGHYIKQSDTNIARPKEFEVKPSS
ncbi:hypothetical protein AX774_g7633 [Zancudomyces culisetae]|uniref:Uncharacterized protein n=1 Tax=Zancudomyces culisetae TaxID=1213189 RepID=A0A1R1PD91_ZANCU|nr:hypothetical protein AX774_g7633 [Zancudomyces culisetae]|eukprot:OMH78965.1 hypothetical protein AX774_g7633 [Zancudomyces culisetae]